MNAARVIAELRELDARSGGQRIAWSDIWAAERQRLSSRVATELPESRIDRDEAGNLWFVLSGGRPGTIIAGSHIDCVPEGGWLDGCLGLFAALECARQLATEPVSQRRTLAVVDWADEEGAGSGHSLLGSSACAGTLRIDRLVGLHTADGVGLAQLLRSNGVEPERMAEASSRLIGARAYLELHIEQGPVLEHAGHPCASVSGCFGVRRSLVRFTGTAAHAGATPMTLRRDPTLAAARLVLDARDAATRADGLATVGRLQAHPGTSTAIASAVELVLDLRHADLNSLDRLDGRIAALASDAASSVGCGFEREVIWSIDPVSFDPDLIERASALTGAQPLVSGPLHDAASMARAGVPTAMVFVRTRGGISHSRDEDASQADIAIALEAFGALVSELVHGG